MSKYVFAAALLALSACGEKKADAPAVDSAAVAAPAPAAPVAVDSMAKPDGAMAGDTTTAH